MTLPLSTEIFIAVPVSQKPKEDGKFRLIKDNGKITMFDWPYKEGAWDLPSDAITHYLQKKTLMDVLGNLKIPRWVKASERLPSKYKWPEHDIIHYRVDGVRADGNLIDVEGEVQFDYITVEGNNRVYELHRVEWLEDMPLSDLLYKVAEEAWNAGEVNKYQDLELMKAYKGERPYYEKTAPDKAQYLSQFKSNK